MRGIFAAAALLASCGGSNPTAPGSNAPQANAGAPVEPQPDGGTIAGAPDASSPPPEVLTAGENAAALAIDADNVYWLNIRKIPPLPGNMTYQFVDVRAMPKSGGTPTTLAQTASMFAVSIVAPGKGVVVWSAAACALPCDYPGAGREQATYTVDPAAPHGYRMLAGAFGGSQVAATATTVFSRRLNGVTGKWDLSACAIDGSGCSAIASEADTAEALYADGGRIFWIREGSGGAQLSWNQAAAPYVPAGAMPFVPSAVALRVNGDAVAMRSGPEIWTGTLGGTMTRVRTAASGSDIDISHGRIYWNAEPSGQREACLGTARLDGTDARCLEQGQHRYGTVRVDENDVWFIRDGQVARVPR